jgi:hypothetical protein
MTKQELCEWLRANSSGIYRPAAEAADTIERLDALCREMIRSVALYLADNGDATFDSAMANWDQRRKEA